MSADSISLLAAPRRRQRPYLNWLERSRDNWKSRALHDHALVAQLRRRVHSLTASRDRWREQSFDLRREIRLERLEHAKNGPRS